MPKLIKNILVPTDFSESSVFALKAAIKLARKISARIYLYHRVHLHPNWNIWTDEEKACHPNLLKKESEVMDRFKEALNLNRHTGIKIISLFSSGDLVDRAEQLVEKYDVDFVVMGSEGADGLKEWLYGSNAQKISTRVNVPCMVIKHEVEELSLKKVVFASEFGEDAKKPFLELIDFLQIFGSTIHLLYIASIKEFVVQEETLEKMRKFEKMCWKLPCEIHGQADQTIEMGIQNYMVNSQADMLAVVNHQKGPFQKLVAGSISEKLINHMEGPVMSFPADKREVETQDE